MSLPILETCAGFNLPMCADISQIVGGLSQNPSGSKEQLSKFNLCALSDKLNFRFNKARICSSAFR